MDGLTLASQHLVSCCYGTMYLKTIDCSGVSTRVDGPWLAEMLSTAIKEVKVENVVPKLSQIMHLIVLAWVTF